MSRKKQKKGSYISELRMDGKINENFLNTVSELKLEELIAIKLEQSAKMMNGKLYNFPIWYTLPVICRDACMKIANRVCMTKTDMANFLGIPYNNFKQIHREYNKNI